MSLERSARPSTGTRSYFFMSVVGSTTERRNVPPGLPQGPVHTFSRPWSARPQKEISTQAHDKYAQRNCFSEYSLLSWLWLIGSSDFIEWSVFVGMLYGGIRDVQLLPYLPALAMDVMIISSRPYTTDLATRRVVWYASAKLMLGRSATPMWLIQSMSQVEVAWV